MIRLKELRIEKNLSQWDVANGIQTGQRNISRWEKGEVLPTSDFIIKLADFFEVSTDYLLGRTDELGNITVVQLSKTSDPEEEELLEIYRNLPRHLKNMGLSLFRTWSTPKSKNTLPH